MRVMILGAAFSAVTAGAFAQEASEAEARALVEAAAAAMGGLDQLRQIETMTLVGYGQWAYQFGGGNITGSPEAPQKWGAANELRRVYDLSNDRFQQYERRNYLFPFAGAFGHAFAPTNLVLDGDIAFNLNPEGEAQRVGDTAGQGSQRSDSPYMRRMLMLNNPVAAILTALDETTTLAGPREADGLDMVDLTIDGGHELSLGFEPGTGLLTAVEWVHAQDNMGQLTYTTHLTGYVPFGEVLLPLGYNTVIDWRDVDFFKMYVDNYVINGEVPDLAAPPEVAAAAEPVLAPPAIEAEVVADHVWRLSAGGIATFVFEFSDHLTLFEVGGNLLLTEAVIDAAEALVPGKPVTEAIVSHHHSDHSGGFRAAVAAGLTIIAHEDNEAILREWAERRAPDFPDALERNFQEMEFVPVRERLTLSDDLLSVDLYWARENIHAADLIFAYVPSARLLIDADIATAAEDWQYWSDNHLDIVEHYGLDVEIWGSVHEDTMTFEEVRAYVQGGVDRARARCEEQIAVGNFIPGCPIQSDRF